MNPRVIYLQTSFWKKMRNDTSVAGVRCLMNVYEAILESDLRTDISDDDFDTDPYLVLLWKRHVASLSNVDLYDEIVVDKPKNNVEDLCAIYLTEVNIETCKNLGAQFGIVAINHQEAPQKECLFKGDGFMLKKNVEKYCGKYLSFESNLNYPCNTMLLIDPYILSKKENIENDLLSLLDAVLPDKKLQFEFQIAIFSMIGNKNSDSINGSDWFNRIKEIIGTLRKGLNFDLTLYAIGPAEEFHSRMLITNNVYLNAADGFDVFRDNETSNKNAKFDIVLPRLVGDNRQDMSNYLRWIKIAKRRSAKQSETQFWGTRKNRLFDLVK